MKMPFEEREGFLKADFHCHSHQDPRDRIKHSEEELIDAAAARGYQVLSITNHNTVTFSPELEEYARSKGILLIPGTELTIEGKHVLLLNLRDGLPKVRRFEELASLGEEVAIIAPHAYYFNRLSLNSKLAKHHKLFHAVEYSHFYLKRLNPNLRLLMDAQKWALSLVGTSDTHYLFQLGTTYSLVEAEKAPHAIIEAIKKGKVEVVTRPLTVWEALRVFNQVFVYFRLFRLLRAIARKLALIPLSGA